MLGIFKKPFIDLDDMLPMQVGQFQQLQLEIIEGLAKSTWSPCSFGSEMRNSVMHHPVQTHFRRFREGVHANQASLKRVLPYLRMEQKYRYLQLRFPTACAHNTVVLRSGENFSTNDYVTNCVDRVAFENFEFLRPWINSLPFKTVGRIAFFIQTEQAPVLTHTDAYGESKGLSEFLWFSLGRKRFFIEDGETKHYVTGTANWFNTDDMHGADAVDSTCWSMRVDGEFSESFRGEVWKRHALQ